MIYPSYAVKADTYEESVEIGRILYLLDVNTRCITKWPQTYYVNGEFQKCQIEPLDIPIVSYEEFINIYKSFYKELHDFIDNLEVGDKVVIEERRGSSGDYPLSFSDSMLQYSGREMTIKSIRSSDYCRGPRFYNGSDKCFCLLEDNYAYAWHSSMFVMPPSVPVKVLNLSDISINSLIIQ